MTAAVAKGQRIARLRLACGAVLVVSFLALVPLQRSIDRELAAQGSIGELLYLPSGTILRRLSLGHDGLLADIYWTRVVQYFGRKRLSGATRYDLLGSLLRITTELDPHLVIAYRFGAIFLAEKAPAGAGQPQEALQLLRRGIVANPDYWRLWQDLGFIYYWDLKDYASAARVFQAGSERPGAQIWMKVMAASVASQGGAARTSRLLWSEIYRQAGNEQIRVSARNHLLALQAQEEMESLNTLLKNYRQAVGYPARSFHELVVAGLLRFEPRDPSGAPYRIGPDGLAALSAGSKIDLRLLQ
jgi:tetratricopeptide (TPR) repeat protein